MTRKTLVILLAIVGIAFFLRIYNLATTPPSPDWDEAALGYNAYSILKTGRDEFGSFLPLTLRSFNDYKPAFYAYTAVPAVAVFGLNLFSVRFPSVAMGTLSVLGVFFLCEALRRLLTDKSRILDTKFSLLVAFLLAISPWHLQFSRVAFEANSALFLIIYGAVFLLHGLQKPKLLLLSGFFFSISLYAYHSSRIFVPLLLLIVFLILRNQLMAAKKYFFGALILGIILSHPALLVLISPAGRQRFSSVSIYSDQTGLLRKDVAKIEQDKKEGIIFANILHNRRLTYLSTFAQGYLSHFEPKWLFLTGDSVGRHHAPDMGLIYLIELPFILIGMYQILKLKGKGKWIVASWFLLTPLASAPTNQVPHAVRSYFFLPIFQIFCAIGILTFYHVFRKNSFGIILFSILIFIFSLNIIYYFDLYHQHLSLEYSQNWQYGYAEAISESEKLSFRYNKIIFSEKLEQPYIFYLFYTKFDPQKYLVSGGSNNIDFNNWSHLAIGKYEFKLLDWSKEEKNSRILYVGTPQDFDGGAKVLKTIYYLDGKPAIQLVEG